MTTIYIIIIIAILLLTIYFWIDSYEKNIKKADTMCNLENFDIDNMHIIKRDPSYEKLINEIIDKKSSMLLYLIGIINIIIMITLGIILASFTTDG